MRAGGSSEPRPARREEGVGWLSRRIGGFGILVRGERGVPRRSRLVRGDPRMLWKTHCVTLPSRNLFLTFFVSSLRLSLFSLSVSTCIFSPILYFLSLSLFSLCLYFLSLCLYFLSLSLFSLSVSIFSLCLYFLSLSLFSLSVFIFSL